MQELNGSHSHQNSIYYFSKCNRIHIFIQQINRFSETLHCSMVWYFVIFCFPSRPGFTSNENFLSIFGSHVPESTIRARFTPIEVSHHHQYALQSKQHSLRIYLFFLLENETRTPFCSSRFSFDFLLLLFYYIFIWLFTYSNFIVLQIFLLIICIEIDE